ncbi:MAG: hypothetical protein P9X24_15040 [Candidatus Hatepunaea meridiana]|nr:hypothetical protein [Candidatus Hatepunaea meridiana]
MSESIIGFGSFVLKSLDKPKSIDSIWSEFENVRNSDEYPAYQSFDNLILTIDFLYTIGLLELHNDGRLQKCA